MNETMFALIFIGIYI